MKKTSEKLDTKKSSAAAYSTGETKVRENSSFGYADNRPQSQFLAGLQRMKIEGAAKAATVSGTTNTKHVVASGDQAAAAKANYGDSTFVRNASLLSDAIDADDHDFVGIDGQSATVNTNASIVIDLWEKTEDAPAGLAKDKPVAKTIDNTSTSCQVGARKFGDGTIKVVHFKKN